MTAPRSGTITWTEAAGEPFLSDEAATRALDAALDHASAPHRHVDVIVVDAATLARLHGDFLDDPSETDVITFDLREGGDQGDGESSKDAAGPEAGPERGADGEIYVSAARAREVAAARGGDVARELSLYIVHGGLHLAGMDDHEDEDRSAMRAAERAVLASLGFSDDSEPHDLD